MDDSTLDAMFPGEVVQVEPEAIEPVAENVVQEVVEAPEPVAEAPETEAPVEREEKSVPLATFLDMRDKLKDAERRAADLEAAKPAPQPQDAPDPFDDPKGFAAYQRQEVQAAVLANKFEMSDVIARQSHGVETVEAATNWAAEKAKSNPAFAAEYMREAHPIDWIVRQHKRDVQFAQIGDDPDEFVRRRAAELGLIAPTQVQQVPVVQQQAAKPAAPPRSIASDASPASVAVVDPQAEFNAIFDRK